MTDQVVCPLCGQQAERDDSEQLVSITCPNCGYRAWIDKM